MRKHQQRQILEILQTLYEAQAAGMYADCQEAAIGVGEFIESIAGESTQTVALLEDYCEMLFQASNGETGEKQLRKQLISIENSVKNKLKPNRVEMAFLPYNLSMWDSLESIYLASKDDPQCDAYVVPLPYYDFDDETKTLGEKMHYDGDKYPPNIPVTHWQAYDIEERHPDIVFIHYAYDDDGNNFSVPPEFYSKELRQHCELLIYVPYYVSREKWIPQYFADLPGVLNAHHVIVQSEAVRQVYIDHFNKSAKEYGFGEQYGKAKDKFLALGSPKFDKVINTNREDCPLPPEWKELITKPDGTSKKIILYNTHMFTWINNAEQYFKKIRSVFSIFKNRDDVVLWWRPHPGTELNFQQHLPEMLGDYYAVVKEYQEGNVGIYDDTPDLHRAIAWSDAYYGDESSLMLLYEATGKPLVGQGIKIPCAFTERRNAWTHIGSVYDNKLYYHIPDRNTIYALNLDTFEPEYFGNIPGKPIYGSKGDYCYFGASNDKLYFLPFYGDEISIYDLCAPKSSEQRYQAYKLDIKADCKTEYRPKGKNPLFSQYIIHRDRIFLLPLTYSQIIAYDTKTGETTHCLDLRAILQGVLAEEEWQKQSFFYHYAFLDADTVLLPMRCANVVLEFNLSNYSHIIHRIGAGATGLSGIFAHKGHFWITAMDKAAVYRWHYASGAITEFTEFPSDLRIMAKDKPVFFARASIVQCQNYIYLFPGYANMACRMDMDSGAIERLPEFDEHIAQEGETKVTVFADACAGSGKLYILKKAKRTILEYDVETRAIRECEKPFDLSDDDYRRVSNDYFDSLAGGFEMGNTDSKIKADTLGTAGQAIYDFAKKEIVT